MKKVFLVFALVAFLGCTLKVYHYNQPGTMPAPELVPGLITDTAFSIFNEGIVEITGGDGVTVTVEGQTVTISVEGEHDLDTIPGSGLPLDTVGFSALVTPPRGTQDYQIAARAPYDSVLVLSNEWDPVSAKYGLGRWRQLRPLIDSLVGASGGPDLNGLFDSTNEGDTVEVIIAKVDDDGLYFEDLDGTGYFAYETSATGLMHVDYDARPALWLNNLHVSYGTWLDFFGINEILAGVAIDGSFQIKDGAVVPFLIEPTTTVNNSLKIEADGDLVFADYPNTRDDGTPTNVYGSQDASGTLGLYPVADLGFMDNWLLGASGTGGTESITDNETVTITGAGINVATRSGANVTITATELDGDPANEIQTQDATGTSTVTWDLSGDATDVSLTGAGIAVISRTGNAVTVTATETDGSPTNELQTLDVSGTTQPITYDLSSDATDPTLTGSGAAVVSASGNAVTVDVSTEAIQDAVGPLLTGTQTGIAVTYDDVGNMWDFVTTDQSATNEIQTLDATGTSTVTWDLSSDASDVSLTGAGIAAVSRVGNAVTVTATEIDGSTSNEIQTLSAGGAGPTSYTVDLTGSGTSVTLAEGTGVNLTRSTNTITVASTVLDEQSLTFDGASGPVGLNIDNGTGVSFIEGTNITMTSTGTTMTINATGGAADGNGMWTAANDGTDIANTTFDVGVPGYLNFELGTLFVDGSNARVGVGSTSTPSYGFHVRHDAGAAVEANSDNVNIVMKLEGTAEGGTGADTALNNFIWAYTDTDYASGVEQTAVDMGLWKHSDTGQRSVFGLIMRENSDAMGLVIEKNEAFNGVTQESHISINGGFANTQNYEWSAVGADLTLDRSFFAVAVTGTGTLGDEILLPNVYSAADNWQSVMATADCLVGQEYVITNYRATTNLIVRVNSGDQFRGAAATITIQPGFSARLRCNRFNSSIGYWSHWLSD